MVDKIKQSHGITLIALIIIVILLVILVGVTIANGLNKKGIIEKAKLSNQQMEEAKALEEMNMLINEKLMDLEEENKEFSLQELADSLCDDISGRIEYVEVRTKIGALDKVEVNNSNIFVKLTNYDYEFEIGHNFKIVSMRSTIGTSQEQEKKIEISINKNNLKIGERVPVNININPEGANPNDMIWISTNSNIAYYSDGYIYGAGNGSAIITAKMPGGEYTPGKIEVYVINEQYQE